MLTNNNNTNYTNYYNILNFLGDTISSHPSINSVQQGPITDIDNKEFPNYPFGNIIITGMLIRDNTTLYSVILTIGDKVKDIKNEDIPNQPQLIDFYGNDDEVDVFANTSGILNDILSYIDKGTTQLNIDGDINMSPFSEKFRNHISGFSASFNIKTFNDRNRCLLGE